MTLEQIRAARMWVETEPNAPKHFTKAGNESCRKTILFCLSACEKIAAVDGEALEMAINNCIKAKQIHDLNPDDVVTMKEAARLVADIKKANV